MPDLPFDLTDQTMKELAIDDAVARQNVAWFANRYGAQAGAYRRLACYAAMPLVLTPELLNYLHNRFLADAGLPWVAEVDLLLSELVHPVGEELYAMPPATRAYLLKELRQRVGDAALANVARVLIHYTRRLARTNAALDDEELRAQQWAAMVYLDELRPTAVREIAEAFRAVADQLAAQPAAAPFDMQRAEFARLAHLTKMLAPQIQAHPELVEYAHLMSRLLAGDDAGAAEYGVQIEGVTLHVPEQLRPASRRDAPPATHLVYREIRIRIHHGVGENNYQVEVLFPTGEHIVSTHTLDARMLIVSASVFLEQREPNLEREARQLGQELHDLLFDRAAAPHWAEARSTAHNEQQGLRLLLDVDPPELALMPWEILHDGNAFLSVTDGIEIIRLQPHSASTAPVRTPGPLRILSVIASQPDLATIDTTNVKRALDEALTPALSVGLLELSWLENPSLAALRSVVRKQQFDVFYFVGYRAHDPQRQESYLLLTDNDGQAQRVSSIELSKLLATQRSLWLAVLSADDSARGEPGDPGLAAELAQSGIPAVVGVQGIMHYSTAVRFAQRFFDALTRGRAIAEAVQAARMEVHEAAPDRFEWALPVLYTAAPDNILVVPGISALRRSVGAQLHSLRVSARPRLTMRAAAAYIGLSESTGYRTIGQWESGHAVPVRTWYTSMCRYLWCALGLHTRPVEFANLWGEIEIAWEWPPLTEQDWRELRSMPCYDSSTTSIAPDITPLSENTQDGPGVGGKHGGTDDLMTLAGISTQYVTFDWVDIPAGPFLMGSDKKQDNQAYDNELPQQTVTLPAYRIARTPVTVAQFAAFVQATGYTTDAEHRGQAHVWNGSKWEWVKGANWQHPRGPESDVHQKQDHPVTCVTWQDAVAFCRWASEVTRIAIRLPTEAEWEKAARATDGRRYPWGNEKPTPEHCNFNMNVGDTTPVGSYPKGASPYGMLDVAGNVWEWTSSLFKGYPYELMDGREDTHDEGWRTVRGGSFYRYSRYVRCACRLNRSDPYNSVGLRVASPGSEDSGL